MNKLFRPKCLRRVLLCLALLFPIVYLCGGLFFALAGSHGNYDWHENTLVNRDYDDAIKTENFKYSDWDWNNSHGTRLGFSLGHLYSGNYVDDFVLAFSSVGVALQSPTTNEIADYGLGFTGEGDYFSIDLSDSELIFDESIFSLSDFHFYSCFYLVPQNIPDSVCTVVICDFVRVNWDDDITITYYGYDSGFSIRDDLDWYGWSSTKWYFDDGAHLPEGVEWNETLSSYFVPTLKPIESDSLSDYIFSQPFESNNFITSLGKDLVNGSTKGFNPMNELFRSINSNIMNFDDSDNLAMFGLGYVYYAVNVLIVYEVLILAIKLIMLPLRAVELFDKKEDI